MDRPVTAHISVADNEDAVIEGDEARSSAGSSALRRCLGARSEQEVGRVLHAASMRHLQPVSSLPAVPSTMQLFSMFMHGAALYVLSLMQLHSSSSAAEDTFTHPLAHGIMSAPRPSKLHAV